MRLSYGDAIKWLNDRHIQHEAEDAEGNPIRDDTGKVKMVDHIVGDDIAEAAERQMTDIIGSPVFLYGFPAELKAFYMKKAPGPTGDDGSAFTESCDLLMPGVGEIVGGSMRISDMEELLAAYKREGIDSRSYYWFTDQRKYGTCEHGGYGLGIEVRVMVSYLLGEDMNPKSSHSVSWLGWRTDIPSGACRCYVEHRNSEMTPCVLLGNVHCTQGKSLDLH